MAYKLYTQFVSITFKNIKGLISIRKRLKGKRIKINILNDKWDTHNICQQGMLYLQQNCFLSGWKLILHILQHYFILNTLENCGHHKKNYSRFMYYCSKTCLLKVGND